MKVLILGGGTVGSTAADFLCKEGHKVTVIDRNPDVIDLLGGSLDIRGIQGNASSVAKLVEAGAATQDLCLALTNNSEVNLVIKSQYGWASEISSVIPYLYHVRYFRNQI